MQQTSTSTRTVTLDGTSASKGVAYGPAFLSMAGMGQGNERRLADDEVDAELARVDSVARAARVSLVHQRDELGGHFTPEQRRIFDTHLAMLEDPVIEADLRGRIVNDRLTFETALKDVLAVYERLFDVVESSNLRNKLSDMRDVALRLLRFAKPPSERRRGSDRKGGILVVKELSLSDLTDALDHGITGLIAEEGSLGSHGAILTRAAGIPAVIGVGSVDGVFGEGDHVLVDGDSGQVVLNPPPEMVGAAQGRSPEGGFETLGPAALGDGTRVDLRATAGSPSEAKQAVGMGVKRIGLYRTELPVIQRQGAPREDSLAVLYGQVTAVADDVVFRLPDLGSNSELSALHPEPEANPALGLRGVRLLLARPELLLTQLRAMLRACEGKPVNISVPFATDLEDLRGVRRAADQAREELRLEGADVSHPVQIGVIVETPSAALLGREMLRASDFASISLDTLAMHLLASDRRCAYRDVCERLARPHPVVLRAVRKLVDIADGLEKPIGVYGEALHRPGVLQLMVGIGVRRFAVRSDALREVHARLASFDQDTCERVAEAACHAGTAEELRAALPQSWLG